MFARTQTVEDNQLLVAMLRLLDEMDATDPDSPEYSALLINLERITALRTATKPKKREWSADSLILAAGNLLGILIIVAYEQKHVMSSKGLGFVRKS